MYASQKSVNDAANTLIAGLRRDPNARIVAPLSGSMSKANERYIKNRIRDELDLDVLLVSTKKKPYTVEVISTAPII